MEKHVSIFGVCVLRDIFRLCDKDHEYIIDKYVQMVSPVSAVGTSPLERKWDDTCENCYDVCIEWSKKFP